LDLSVVATGPVPVDIDGAATALSGRTIQWTT
jgi:hypothetical protein